MFAEQINESWYAAGVAMHGFDRFGNEDLFSRTAGDTQPLVNITLSFKQR